MKKNLILVVIVWLSGCSFPAVAAPTENGVKKWQEVKEIDGEKVKVQVISKPTSTTFDAPAASVELTACAANIVTDYWQEDDLIKVETLVENTQCGPSKGRYTVKVRTRNDAGDLNTSKYQEQWSRDDNGTIKAIHTYSMNGHKELVRVRIQPPFNGACLCTGDTTGARPGQTD
ncbi:MAG: hypothetical protein JKX81_12785 [Arenicella sp.]|nr:hypothetical protein [Arenicella sp.]